MKRLLLLLLVLHTYTAGYIVSLNGFKDEKDAIVSIGNSVGVDWDKAFQYLTYVRTDDEGIASFRTYPFTTIDSSGFYILANNVSNQITISASNVTLDLNGHTVSGGTNGIVINGNLNNITIKNGVINSVTTDGIQINAGCQNVTLHDVSVKSSDVGINVYQVTNAIFRNCDVNLNTQGIQLSLCHNVVLENCSAQANTQRAYSLLTTTSCSLFDCKAISTGDGNGNSSGSDSFVYGFATENGHGNHFERCVANSTQNLDATNWNTVIAGFAILGTSTHCCSIIECEAGSGTSNAGGHATPYGIWIEETVSNLGRVSGIDSGIGTSNSHGWSPDAKYVAVHGTTSNEIQVYSVNYDNEILEEIAAITEPAGTVNDIAWSPDGRYIAACGSTLVYVYKFNPIDVTITLVDQFDHTAAVDSVSWSYDARYLAFSGTANGSATHQILSFNRLNETLTFATSGDTGATTNGIDFSHQGYLVATGNTGGTVEVELFDPGAGSLTSINTLALTGAPTVNEVHWAYDDNYLLATTSSNATVISYAANTLTQEDTIGIGGSSNVWSPNGRYITYTTGGQTVNIASFNRSTGTLSAVVSGSSVATTLQKVRWSPEGRYITSSQFGGASGFSVFLNSALLYPIGNVIQNCQLYCNRGGLSDVGFGISGSSIANLIIQNSAFDNGENYIFVTNVFNQLFGDAPTLLQNLQIDSNDPIEKRIDFPTKLRRLELLAESLIDNLL